MNETITNPEPTTFVKCTVHHKFHSYKPQNKYQLQHIFFLKAQQPLVGQTSQSHSRHTTLSRTPLDERSTWLTDLHLTTHNTLNRVTSKPTEGFEPAFPISGRPWIRTLAVWPLGSA